MIFHFEKLIANGHAAKIADTLESEEFVSGDLSAAYEARQVKNNKELSSDSAVGAEFRNELTRTLWQNPLFRTIAMPKRVVGCIFSRYEVGMTYGDHIDNSIMQWSSGDPVRADMSMTLFLDDASEYGGGELIVNAEIAPQAVKLDRGDAILYPTSDYHRVEPVTHGVRRVALFWIQSLVPDPRKREILTEMWVALDYLHKLQPPEQAKDNKAFATLSKARENLLRMWAEV